MNNRYSFTAFNASLIPALKAHKRHLVSAFFLCMTINTHAQKIDTTQVTSKVTPSVSAPKNSVKDSFPFPKKALLYSIIPGGGQIYNRKLAWLKVPIVYGGFITGGVLIANNSSNYARLKKAYIHKINNEPINDPKIPETATAATIKERRDVFFKSKQQSYIFTGVWYLLSAAEAFTAAHLAHFDVKDDLSLHIKPSFEPVPFMGNAVGIGITIVW